MTIKKLFNFAEEVSNETGFNIQVLIYKTYISPCKGQQNRVKLLNSGVRLIDDLTIGEAYLYLEGFKSGGKGRQNDLYFNCGPVRGTSQGT